ncbi:LINE-1 retrotransposable element ORF2 protein [Bienertia sinuspersici]
MADQYRKIRKDYSSFLTQRAKIEWLKHGDENTKFFHQCIKIRQHKQKVLEIKSMDGTMCTSPETVEAAFEQYYKHLLGSKTEERIAVQQDIIDLGPKIEEKHMQILMQEVTEDEVKQCMHSIPGSKSPGPDGYNSTFYKASWKVIGEEISVAIKDFFSNAKMLKELNCTKLTLIPKVNFPKNVTEFRPIACCNTIYKCIAKLLCNRLKKVLPDIISQNQSGFVEGRQIVHNVSIVQDLVGIYNRKASPPGCLLKVDIRKAYDSVQWDFLKEMMKALNFPDKFIHLIMNCVTTPSYSLVTNGKMHGFFQGKQGLRQGDPISPLLFVICMEYLSRLLKYVGMQKGYKFHYRCKSLSLNHLVFADDLIIFCRGEKDSVMANMRALATFAKTSGLIANAGKSALYACNMDKKEKEEIIQATGFVEEALPFRYLGVKISAKKLSAADCDFMTEKIVSKIRSWGTRSLSYAGRAQLVNATLLNLHTYWASMFFIPKKVLDQVTNICRTYLWSGQAMSSKTPLIAWDWVCRPKKEGGLGYKDSYTWNLALLGKYVWSIANKADNLWVKWINAVYLKDQDWKNYMPAASASWYWKNLCKVKDRFRQGYELNRWSFDPRGYSAASGYKWLRGDSSLVNWDKWVWGRYNIPRTSFISWLIMWKRIQTKDRLKRIGLTDDDKCCLCGLNAETPDHIFFDCYYAQKCFSRLRGDLKMDRNVNSLDDLNRWLQKPIRGREKAKVIWSCYANILYHIWLQRNEAWLTKRVVLPEKLVDRVLAQCWIRITNVVSNKHRSKIKDWCKNLFNSLY